MTDKGKMFKIIVIANKLYAQSVVKILIFGGIQWDSSTLKSGIHPGSLVPYVHFEI